MIATDLWKTSLSRLVDKLSGVYDKECKKCMERKTIRSNCEFVGFKNSRLNYKCKEWKKSCAKVVTESTKTFPTLHKFWIKKRYLSIWIYR